MKRILIVITCVLAWPLIAKAQGARLNPGPITSAINTPGPISTVNGAKVSVCTHPANAVPCTNFATTYTDSTLGTPCANNKQIVLDGASTCVTNVDNFGNWGAWVAAGTYDYTVTIPSGGSYGPFSVTVGGSGGGGSPGGGDTQVQVNHPAGTFSADSSFAFNSTTKKLSVPNINTTLYVDGVKYTTISAAIADCPAAGCQIIVPNGNFSISSTVTIPAGAQVFLGAGTYTCTVVSGACFNLTGDNAKLIGRGTGNQNQGSDPSGAAALGVTNLLCSGCGSTTDMIMAATTTRTGALANFLINGIEVGGLWINMGSSGREFLYSVGAQSPNFHDIMAFNFVCTSAPCGGLHIAAGLSTDPSDSDSYNGKIARVWSQAAHANSTGANCLFDGRFGEVAWWNIEETRCSGNIFNGGGLQGIKIQAGTSTISESVDNIHFTGTYMGNTIAGATSYGLQIEAPGNYQAGTTGRVFNIFISSVLVERIFSSATGTGIGCTQSGTANGSGCGQISLVTPSFNFANWATVVDSANLGDHFTVTGGTAGSSPLFWASGTSFGNNGQGYRVDTLFQASANTQLFVGGNYVPQFHDKGFTGQTAYGVNIAPTLASGGTAGNFATWEALHLDGSGIASGIGLHVANSSAVVDNALITGTTPAGITPSTAHGVWACTETGSTGITPTALTDYIRCDLASHTFKCSQNGAAEFGCFAGGGGGVTSFTGDGALITNSASTGAVTATLGNAGAHKYWGNPTGVSAAPAYSSLVVADLPTAIPIGNIGSAGLSGTAPISISAAGAISITNPLPVANGGTGTGSTLTGVVRGGSPMTASELSGVVITSASNVTTPGKIDVTNANAFCQAAGASSTTYTCNLSPAITAYVTGTHYRFKADVANSGAATINFNAVGAISIKKAAGGITTALVANDMQAGQWVDLIYDGTNMQMQSLLGNAPSGGNPASPSLSLQYNNGGSFASVSTYVVVNGGTNPTVNAASTHYLITANTTFNTSAIALSNNNTIVECAKGVVITRATASVDLFDLSGTNDEVKGCILDNGGVNGGFLIKMSGTSGRSTNNTIQGAGTTATNGWLQITAGNDNRIIGTRCDGIGESCIQVNATTAVNDFQVTDTYCNLTGALATFCINVQTNGANVTGGLVDNNTCILTVSAGNAICFEANEPNGLTQYVHWTNNDGQAAGAYNYIFKIFSLRDGIFADNSANDGGFSTGSGTVALGDMYDSVVKGVSITTTNASTGFALKIVDTARNVLSGISLNGFGTGAGSFGIWMTDAAGNNHDNELTGCTVTFPTNGAGVGINISEVVSAQSSDNNTVSNCHILGIGTASGTGIKLTNTGGGGSSAANDILADNQLTNLSVGISVGSNVSLTNLAINQFHTVTTLVSDSGTNTIVSNSTDATTTGAARSTANVLMLASDFTDASSAAFQTITGLSFTLTANLAQNVPYSCHIMWSQATNVADSFGIQSATISPTRIDGYGLMSTAGPAATTPTYGVLTNLTTTTATAIVTATPTVTTVNFAEFQGVIQNPSNASTNVINFVVKQATAGDLIVVKAGSSCRIW